MKRCIISVWCMLAKCQERYQLPKMQYHHQMARHLEREVLFDCHTDLNDIASKTCLYWLASRYALPEQCQYHYQICQFECVQRTKYYAKILSNTLKFSVCAPLYWVFYMAVDKPVDACRHGITAKEKKQKATITTTKITKKKNNRLQKEYMLYFKVPLN